MNFGQPQKERLLLRMTPEERGYFSSLLEMADKNMTGKVEGKTGANFLKKSGLPTDVLKKIWFIAAQTDCSYLERDEFYIALRLVALAQNNMECSAESIRINHPLPPLPKFDLKSETISSSTSSSITNPNIQSSVGSTVPSTIDNNVESANDFFKLSDKEIEGYQNVFLMNKDKPNTISIIKAKQIWSGTGATNDKMNSVVALFDGIINEEEGFTDKAFHAATHIIFKTLHFPSPPYLPEELQEYLSKSAPQTNENIEKDNQTSPDIEAVLLKEFNMKPIVHLDKKSNMNHYKGVSAVGLVNGMKNMLEQIKLMNADAEEENKFLTKELEESLELYNSFIDDIEKVNKVINSVNIKKENVKNEIVDYRRKINIEKDNMAKILVNMKLLQDEIKENSYN